MKKFEEILGFTQEQLKDYLSKYLCGVGYKITSGDGYVFAKGEVPVLLIAHMDTACNKQIPKTIIKEPTPDGIRIIAEDSLVGGDDRCGCWMIMNIIKKAKCSVLFLEDEEIGCVGARKFSRETDHMDYIQKNISFMIELDRRGSNDCVFYSNDNREFINYISTATGTKEAIGSMSDISVLMPITKTAGVNLSCGYYKEHTKDEYVMVSEMEDMMNRVIKFLEGEDEFPAFEYQKKKYVFNGYDDWGWKRKDRRFANEKAIDELDDLTLYAYMKSDWEELYGTSEIKAIGRNKPECWALLFLENPELSFEMIEYYEWL